MILTLLPSCGIMRIVGVSAMEHPGIVLENELSKSDMSRKELSIRTGVTEKHICTVINGDRDISAGFARKLGYVFHDAAYWLKLQNKYDEDQLRIKEENDITSEELAVLKPLHDIMSHFIERGYMHNNCGDISKVMQLRELLGVSDLTAIPKITYNAAYRAQLSENVKVDPYVLFAWQRLCEKETENISVVSALNIDLLLSNLSEIKAQMFGDINEGIHTMQDLFSKCGIAFQIVKNFRGAPVQGFIKESSDGRLILCLTIRGKRADRFWFTLFHEIAHILNGDNKTRFVDFDSVQNSAEIKADLFAGNELIDPDLYREFLHTGDCFSWTGIESFAEKAHVQPYIVLGRLQNDGILDWSDYSDKLVKYEWA